eukprot:767554-Hanusia_phi.AAC.8
MAWNVVNEQWTGTTTLNVSKGNILLFDLDGDLRYACVDDILLDALAPANPSPTAAATGWQLDLSSSALKKGQCLSVCSSQAIPREQP